MVPNTEYEAKTYPHFGFQQQIWCAAGVNLTGGRTKDGGNIVGASVFYSGDTETTELKPGDEVDKLDMELKVIICPWSESGVEFLICYVKYVRYFMHFQRLGLRFCYCIIKWMARV